MEGDASAQPPLDARGLGTLVHTVLAEIDFARPGDVKALVERHAEQHLAAAQRRLEEPIAMIERFLDSPRGASWPQRKRCKASWSFCWPGPPQIIKPQSATAPRNRKGVACKVSSIVSIAMRAVSGG